MNLVGIDGHGLLDTRCCGKQDMVHTEGAEGQVGRDLGYNHRRRSRSDLVSAAIVRVTYRAGIDHF